MRKRLLFKSTSFDFNNFVTSVNELVLSFTKYLLELFLYASREMTKSEFGTISYPSSSST